MMARYAESTSVDSAGSRAEIERTLQRYGATSFAYGWDNQTASVMFQLEGLRVRFMIAMPDPTSREFTHTPERGAARTAEAARKAWEQAGRQRWRALALVIKAKLEAVDSGIVSFETEFAPFVVLPDGRTAGEVMLPAIREAYKSSSMQPIMAAFRPALTDGKDR